MIYNLGSTGVLAIELTPDLEAVACLVLTAGQLSAPVVKILVEPIGQPTLELGR